MSGFYNGYPGDAYVKYDGHYLYQNGGFIESNFRYVPFVYRWELGGGITAILGRNGWAGDSRVKLEKRAEIYNGSLDISSSIFDKRGEDRYSNIYWYAHQDS